MKIEIESQAAWLAERMKGIGGSDAPALYGLSPWQSAYGLWGQKTGLAPSTFAGNEATEWGKQLEDVIVKRFETQHPEWLILNNNRPFDIWRADDCAEIFATPDRLISNLNGNMGILEVKNVAAFKAKDWDSAPPLMYQVQVQHQLIATGLSWAYIVALIGGNDYAEYRIEANPEFHDKHRIKCREFWSLVEAKVPPPTDSHQATAETIKSMFPNDSGESVQLPEEFVEMDEQLEQCKEKIKELEVRKTEITNRLIQCLGAASEGCLPNGVRYTYKTQHRKESISKASSFRVLRRTGK